MREPDRGYNVRVFTRQPQGARPGRKGAKRSIRGTETIGLLLIACLLLILTLVRYWHAVNWRAR